MNDTGLQIFELLVTLAGIEQLSELLASLHELDQGIKNTLSVVGVFTIIFGVMQCFFGFKLFKLWCGFIGFLVGGLVGLLLLVSGLFTGTVVMNIIGLVVLILLCVTGAFIAYKAYLVGVFIYTAATAFLIGFIVLGLITNSVHTGLIGGLAAGVLLGVIAIIYRRFWIIATTSVTGGITIGTSLMLILQSSESILSFLIPLVFIIAGFIIQYKTVKKSPHAADGANIMAAHPSQLPPVYTKAASQDNRDTPD